MEKSYLISDVDGFTPHVSRLVSMMNYVRHTTIESVSGLDSEQLDYLHDSESNTIGALLFHIASVEFAYRVWTTEERHLTPSEYEFWDPGIKLGNTARELIHGKNLEYYIDLLNKVRSDTISALRAKDDDWLNIQRPFNQQPSNNYFRWFHVFEDEINHRGQIRWIIKRINLSDNNRGNMVSTSRGDQY
ncbi:DinB family protein [Paenibacillus gorillae]|uniref:DinB family protein n=1 Tax=Paenibacillus gorillae TaxID=1243662 RepID=UPI0005A62B50|nr:DinB family protein [Paenibacillus gorillae]